MTTKNEVREEIKVMIASRIVPQEIDDTIAERHGEEFRGEVYEYLEDVWVEQNS